MSSNQLLIKHISYTFCNQFLCIFIINSYSLLKILLGWFVLISLQEGSKRDMKIFPNVQNSEPALPLWLLFWRFLDRSIVPSALSGWSIRYHPLSCQSTEYMLTCLWTGPSTDWSYRYWGIGGVSTLSNWPALFYTAHNVQGKAPSGY